MSPSPDPAPLRRRTVVLLLGGAVVVLAVVGVALGVLDRGDLPPLPTDGRPAETPAPEDEGEGDEPDVTATPTATPTPPAPPLTGFARVQDPPSNLADPSGIPPPEPAPAADLRDVQLVGDGSELEITFVVDGRIPIQASQLLWSVDLHLPDDEGAEGAEGSDAEAVTAYSITVQQSGNERFAAVLDWGSSSQTALDHAPEVDDDRLSVRVPAELLERIDGPFHWQAMGQVDGVYANMAPADDLAPFPDPESSPDPTPPPSPTPTPTASPPG